MCVASLLVRMLLIGYTPRVRDIKSLHSASLFPRSRGTQHPLVHFTSFSFCACQGTHVAAGSPFPPDKNKHRRSDRQAATVHPVPGFFSWWSLQQCQPEMHSQLHREYPKSQQPTDFPSDDWRFPIPASAAPLPHLPRHTLTYLVTITLPDHRHLMLVSWKTTHDIHHLAALSQKVTGISLLLSEEQLSAGNP